MEMERKKVSALASLSIILLASLGLVAPTPPVSATPITHRYWVMGGTAKACSHLVGMPPTLDWKTPFQTRAPYFMPLFAMQDITFSDPWTLPGYGMIINLTVSSSTYIGLEHGWYDKNSHTWYRIRVTLDEDGHGWIFLNATGDVDCYTFNNNTGVYWESTGQLAAATGALPSPGPDGVAGTADDGFGDGTPDSRGSSIILLSSTMHCDYWTGSAWALLFESPWPQVLTTGTAYDIVNEPLSELDGWNSTETGQPWEFYAGLDHIGQKVEYDNPKWNAYVTYVCAWSVLEYDTALGKLDVIFQIEEKKVREDVLIADINCDEVCNIVDIVIAALAFDTVDEGPGPDGIPGTGDDKPDADPKYDARGDLRPARGLVNIVDIVRIALDFDERLEP